MTQETAKKYTLTAHDIQAYLCELDIKPTEEVSIYSIEYYFDKLPASNDKLEVHLLPYSKEMIQKIRDEKMQLVTAEEFVKLHQESLTAIRNNDKLQEKLNTAKKVLTNIKWRTERDELETYYVERNQDIHKDAIDALAALEGGEDE